MPPRQLVFDAFTKPELLKRWFGPRGWSLAVCEVDLRVGGGFRFVLRGPDGKQMGMRGVYREIVPPERSVHMESFDDYPGRVAGDHRFRRAGRQDDAHRYGALPVTRGSGRGDPVGHGTRRRGELRQARGVAGFAPDRVRLALVDLPENVAELRHLGVRPDRHAQHVVERRKGAAGRDAELGHRGDELARVAARSRPS